MAKHKIEKRDIEIHVYPARHGETEANVDISLYKTKADHAMRLTPKGIQQAKEMGEFFADNLLSQWKEVKKIYGKKEAKRVFGNIRLWHSTHYRGRETAFYAIAPIAKAFKDTPVNFSYREDPFLFEQKSGLQDGMTDAEYAKTFPAFAADYEKHERFNGRALASSVLGESKIQVAIRVKPFFRTVLEDVKGHNIRRVIVINHGAVLRPFTMAWMRYPPEWIDAEMNPGNCWVRHIHGMPSKYIDEGYIHGENAPIRDRWATQRKLRRAGEIFMLKPDRPNIMVPKGIILRDPYANNAG